MDPLLTEAGPLQKAGKEPEDAGRIATRRRWLPRGQTHLALGHGEAGDRVHHQHDVVALVPEPLGDTGRRERGPDAHDRRCVRGGHHHHRTGQAFRAEVSRDELGHLTTPFADQRHDGHVGCRSPGDHRHQRRLADTGTGENTEPLALPARNEAVEHPHAERQLGRHHAAPQRVRRRPRDRHVGPRDGAAPRPWADRSRRAPGPRARVPRAPATARP